MISLKNAIQQIGWIFQFILALFYYFFCSIKTIFIVFCFQLNLWQFLKLSAVSIQIVITFLGGSLTNFKQSFSCLFLIKTLASLISSKFSENLSQAKV